MLILLLRVFSTKASYLYFNLSWQKEKPHFSKILTNPKGAMFIRAAICTGWSTAEVRSPQTWCRVLAPEARATGDTPQSANSPSSTWLEEGEAGRRDQLGVDFYFPFMVKALRSSVLFFTSRTVKRLSNKPFGCYKCVNMTPGFCTKCWRFSWRVHSYLGFCHSFSPLLSHSSGRGWGRLVFSSFWLVSFYKFLPWISMLETHLLFASCPVSLFLCHTVLTCSCHRLPGDRCLHLECQPQPAFSLRKVKGLALLSFQRSSAWLPPWELMYQSCSVGKSIFFPLFNISVQWNPRDKECLKGES